MERYLKSITYSEKKEKAFAELIEMYKENTKGIVPPTYMKTMSQDEEGDAIE